jgi:hypothetical protein
MHSCDRSHSGFCKPRRERGRGGSSSLVAHIPRKGDTGNDQSYIQTNGVIPPDEEKPQRDVIGYFYVEGCLGGQGRLFRGGGHWIEGDAYGKMWWRLLTLGLPLSHLPCRWGIRRNHASLQQSRLRQLQSQPLLGSGKPPSGWSAIPAEHLRPLSIGSSGGQTGASQGHRVHCLLWSKGRRQLCPLFLRLNHSVAHSGSFLEGQPNQTGCTRKPPYPSLTSMS